MNIDKVLQSGDVQRYHATTVHNKQLLSSHHWEVAVIMLKIYPECSKQLLVEALTHDCSEAFTGDTPSTAKKACPELKVLLDGLEKQYAENVLKLPQNEFSAQEKAVLKLCDILSGIAYTTKQVNLGDQGAFKVRATFLSYYESIRIPQLIDIWTLETTLDEILGVN